MHTATLQELAAEAASYFTTSRREDGTPYDHTIDPTPQWVTDVIYDAHDGMLPEDWRYSCIRSALEEIGDNGTDDAHDFADAYVPAYNGDRIDWLASHASRPGYVDEAGDELGIDHEAMGIMELIGLGIYQEAHEVFGLVWDALKRRTEELEA